MTEQLGFVLINPYSIRKMRTGGILSRLLRRPGLHLIGAELFSPSQKLVDEFSAAIAKDKTAKPKIRDLVVRYIRQSYSPNQDLEEPPRVLLLLFKGENAPDRLQEEVGKISSKSQGGETIRDTFGDYVKDGQGNVSYFEPAVLTFDSTQKVLDKLKIWAKYSGKDSGCIKKTKGASKKVEQTLVMLKPDNFRWPSSRVGTIIDHFSRAGLKMVAVKLVQMSVAMAEDFYHPVRVIFSERFEEVVEDKVKRGLANEFEFSLPAGVVKKVTQGIKEDYAENEFGKIIKFMTGLSPAEAKTAKEKKQLGTEKCLAIIYEGVDGVKKIRGILGATDPNKAAPATVRKEFGTTVMVNTAHASDSVKSAQREFKIIQMDQPNLKDIIENFKPSKRRK